MNDKKANEALFGNLSKMQIKALRNLENKAHKWAEDACNYDIQEKTQTRRRNIVFRDIADILGRVPAGFVYNTDPRGHALKIESEAVPQGMITDWGGYGIISPNEN
jgi:hypothetical protein